MRRLEKKVENLSDLPLDRFTATEWREMGYKIKPKPLAVSYYRWWNGMHYVHFALYTPDAVLPIRGKKAAERRERSYTLLV